MITIKHLLNAAAVGLILSTHLAVAEDTGVRRAANGTVQAVTAPVKIVEGVNDESRKNGPVAGVVVGTARGTVNAAGEVIEGGVDVGVGAVETGVGIVKKVLQPVTGR